MRKKALACVHRLAALGLCAEAFVPALLEALHEVVPSSRNLFDWCDEEGRLIRYFVEGPVDAGIAKLYFEAFHNRAEPEGMPAFASLVDAPAGVRGAEALNTPAFFRSALYQEIWRPQGLHTRIEGIVRGTRGQLLGSLVLYRAPGERPFSREDEQTLLALLPTVARGLERAPPPGGQTEPHVPAADGDEHLLSALSGQVVHASAGAHRLLLLAEQGLGEHSLGLSLQALADRLLQRPIEALRLKVAEAPAAAQASGGNPARSLSVCNGWGRFDLFCALLWPLGRAADGSAPVMPLVQVTIRRMESERVALARVLRQMPISHGQAIVAEALYHGHAHDAIAMRMGVARSTVIDHVRKLHRALGVGSTDALRQQLKSRVGPVVS